MCELTKQGLVAAAVCSMPFEKLGRTQAKVLGVPELPLLMIPHPLGGITLDVVATRADVAAGQLVKLIRERFA